jgi:hypothetical protein
MMVASRERLWQVDSDLLDAPRPGGRGTYRRLRPSFSAIDRFGRALVLRAGNEVEPKIPGEVDRKR